MRGKASSTALLGSLLFAAGCSGSDARDLPQGDDETARLAGTTPLGEPYG